MYRANKRKRGISSVFGTLLALILIITVASTLFLAINNYNGDVERAMAIDDARSREKIVMTDLTVNDDYISAVKIKNLGSITSQIRAYYVDSEFICDPSDTNLNPNGAYINSQSSELLNLTQVQFNPTSYITFATSRGTIAIELESHFMNSSGSTLAPMNTNYGPLRLNFTLFYYRQTDSNGNPLGPWKPGSNVSSAVTYCAWNITVTNIDTRNITLNQYSSLTLVSNAGGSQYPWYINNPQVFIETNHTVSIVYVWDKQLPTTKAASFPQAARETFKVFLSFFGKFSDGTTYGQTIPFEAVLRGV
jgi:hypothetical protein